ncbi:MAG TPA: ABC transporter substrate-binding protein [Candidatus Limnocylindrales bacterium]|nr:ABC transporter substrate-binding protein [Candidatus Limnocylindrales bacterium]
MPVLRAHRPLATLAGLALAVLVAACGGSGASVRPSVPPDATGSLVPAETATPAPSASQAPAFPVTLTDDDGTKVELKAAPEQIVSLTPAETEILYALGAGDRVVGKVEDIANYPPEAKDVPVVGTFSGVDVEKIVAAGTDLVIAGGNGGTQPEAIKKLRDLKIPVLVVYAGNVDGVYHDIELTGDAVGARGEADDLVASMKAGFDQVAAATAGVTKKRVFYETGDQPAIYGIADGSVYEQMIGLAGGTPITTGSATNWEQSTEKLVEADPELIILGDSAYGVTAAAVAKRPGWSTLTAVKNGAIVGIDDIVVTRPGPRLADGLRLLVAAIHPELVLGSPVPAASGG